MSGIGEKSQVGKAGHSSTLPFVAPRNMALDNKFYTAGRQFGWKATYSRPKGASEQVHETFATRRSARIAIDHKQIEAKFNALHCLPPCLSHQIHQLLGARHQCRTCPTFRNPYRTYALPPTWPSRLPSSRPSRSHHHLDHGWWGRYQSEQTTTAQSRRSAADLCGAHRCFLSSWDLSVGARC